MPTLRFTTRFGRWFHVYHGGERCRVKVRGDGRGRIKVFLEGPLSFAVLRPEARRQVIPIAASPGRPLARRVVSRPETTPA